MKLFNIPSDVGDFTGKPCPFCGETKLFVRFDPMLVSYDVLCRTCCARGPGAESREMAIKAWGLRKGKGWNCPFCDSASNDQSSGALFNEHWHVFCKDCFSCGPIATGKQPQVCSAATRMWRRRLKPVRNAPKSKSSKK